MGQQRSEKKRMSKLVARQSRARHDLMAAAVAAGRARDADELATALIAHSEATQAIADVVRVRDAMKLAQRRSAGYETPLEAILRRAPRPPWSYETASFEPINVPHVEPEEPDSGGTTVAARPEGWPPFFPYVPDAQRCPWWLHFDSQGPTRCYDAVGHSEEHGAHIFGQRMASGDAVPLVVGMSNGLLGKVVPAPDYEMHEHHEDGSIYEGQG